MGSWRDQRICEECSNDSGLIFTAFAIPDAEWLIAHEHAEEELIYAGTITKSLDWMSPGERFWTWNG